MKLKDIITYLDSVIPLSFQEDYDNSGLQIGVPEKEILSAMLTLDVTEEVLDEALEKGCNLIISHHPLIFKGIKRLSGSTSAERVILKAVLNETAVYSAHTNLDAYSHGVSRKMAEKLHLQNVKVLVPLKGRLLKLVTYIPDKHLDSVKEAIFSAGAGVIGNYDSCGFSVHGAGSFRAGEKSSPYAGEKGILHIESEVRFETVFLSHLKEKVISALIGAHPYEEAAYDIYSLENDNIESGLGCTGELAEPISEKDFLKIVSLAFDAKGIRYSKLTGRRVKKIALCGGSGASMLNSAIGSGADVFLTADIKYHNFFDAENRLLLIDTGHFESEKFSTEILFDLLNKKFPKFAIRFSETNTNPINYL